MFKIIKKEIEIGGKKITLVFSLCFLVNFVFSQQQVVWLTYHDPVDGKARITVRNTIEPEESVLNMKARERGTIYDPNDIARTTIK